MLLLECLAIFAAAVAIRLPWSMMRTGDDWVGCWMLTRQREHPFKLEMEDSAIGGFFGYPPLQYVLIGLLPRQWQTVAMIHSSSVYDAIVAAIVTYMAGPLAGLLYLTSPLLLPINHRLGGYKTRSLGGLLVFLWFLALWSGYWWAAPVIGILIILGSQFGLQAILFVTPIVALATWTWEPLAALGLTFIPALFHVKHNPVRQVWSTRWNHWKWYFRNQSEINVADRNRIKDWRNPTWKLALAKTSWTIALLGAPEIIYWLFLPPISAYPDAIILGCLWIFILTSFRKLLFLGEAERYLEFAVPFAAVLLSAHTTPSLAGALIALHVAASFLNFWYLHRHDFKALHQPLTDEVLDVALELHRQARDNPIAVACSRTKISFLVAAALNDPKIKFLHPFTNIGDGFKWMDRDMPTYYGIAPKRDGITHYLVEQGITPIGTPIWRSRNGQFILCKA